MCVQTYRRRLFFIGGFDPRGPRAIHRIWKQEAPKQAQVSGGKIEVGPLSRLDDLRVSCVVQVERHGARARTEVILLKWDDLVRKWWRRGSWSMMACLPACVFTLWRSGVYRLARQRARPMFLSLMLPPVVLGLMLVVLAVLVGLAALAGWGMALVALAGGISLMPLIWQAVDRRLGLSWLTQCVYYMGYGGSRELEDRRERGEVFARDLIQALDSADVDEVAVVGFSLGANEAIRALGLALEQRPNLGQGRVKLSLILMGQLCAPYGQIGGDISFATARQKVAQAKAIKIINVTSASDPASACTLSPLEGLEGVDEGRVVNRRPRFHKLLTPERFAAIRRDPLAFHFQYLHATDVAGDYDWFGLTCGLTPVHQKEGV